MNFKIKVLLVLGIVLGYFGLGSLGVTAQGQQLSPLPCAHINIPDYGWIWLGGISSDGQRIRVFQENGGFGGSVKLRAQIYDLNTCAPLGFTDYADEESAEWGVNTALFYESGDLSSFGVYKHKDQESSADRLLTIPPANPIEVQGLIGLTSRGNFVKAVKSESGNWQISVIDRLAGKVLFSEDFAMGPSFNRWATRTLFSADDPIRPYQNLRRYFPVGHKLGPKDSPIQ